MKAFFRMISVYLRRYESPSNLKKRIVLSLITYQCSVVSVSTLHLRNPAKFLHMSIRKLIIESIQKLLSRIKVINFRIYTIPLENYITLNTHSTVHINKKHFN